MSYTKLIYHIVWATRYRRSVLDKQGREELYQYLAGMLVHRNCVVHAINGIDDHLHILAQFHPTLSMSKVVMDLKRASSHWIRRSTIFPEFVGWQQGYAAFTVRSDDWQQVKAYIDDQENHHNRHSFENEYIGLLTKARIEFKPDHLWQ